LIISLEEIIHWAETWPNLKKLNVKEKDGRYIPNDDDLFGEWTFKPYQFPRLPPFNLQQSDFCRKSSLGKGKGGRGKREGRRGTGERD
jgi:hypothetical protein